MPSASPDGPPLRVGPFDAIASEGGWGAGWTVGGTGWYRKAFDLSVAAGERVELRFDGSYLDTDVWLNGVHLGSDDQGHLGFAFDLTPHLAPGGRDLLAVRVRSEGFNSRWYNGAGIYRHVWLVRTGPVRIPLSGVAIRTPEATRDSAVVEMDVEVENRGPERARTEVAATLRDPEGTVAGEARAVIDANPGETLIVPLRIALPSPRLWSLDDPAMHAAEVTLLRDGECVDQVTEPFGVRTVTCDAENGLRINGVPLKLKGAAIHADNGLLGAMAFDRAEIRKVELLKANGFNAIRCAHNPFSPAFLDACDRLGMLVVAEIFDVWNEGKLGHDLGARRFADCWRSDVETFVRRDRNRPAIIFWQIGNEITERDRPEGVETATNVRDAFRALDPTRPLTAGLTIGSEGPKGEPSRRGLDVVGYNYLLHAYEPDHAASPDTVFMATESFAADYAETWAIVERHPWMIGAFCWTAIDFLGEVGVGGSNLRRDGEKPPPSVLPFTLYTWDYPFWLAGCGEIDILGRKRPPSFYRDVLWGRRPIALFVQRPAPPGFHEEVGDWGWPDELASWTWPERSTLTVRAYCAGDEVRLLLNGHEVGRIPLTAADRLKAEFTLPFAPGELTAVGYRDGREIGRETLTTVGEPIALRLHFEDDRISTGPGELAYAMIEVCDALGRPVSDAQADVEVSLDGPARLEALGSANPRGIESLRDARCTTYQGVAQAILRPVGAGVATIRAASPGLISAQASVSFSTS